MLKKVFFFCLFLPWNPLLLPAAEFHRILFCLDFPYLLSRKIFKCCPPEPLLGASKGLFRKGFFFFFLFHKYFNACFFDLAEATRCSLIFFPNKFLSCHRNKCASSLNISLNCCAGQLRLLKYYIF